MGLVEMGLLMGSLFDKKRMNPLALRALAVGVFLVGMDDACARAQGVPSEADLMARRIQQASELKAGAERYVVQARKFHRSAEALIAESKNLENEARLLSQNSPNTGEPLKGSAKFTQGIHLTAPAPLKLTTAQYALALNQYSSDISKFAEHAQLYNLHLAKFNTEIGACHANDQAYADNLKKYGMHINEFHLPNLRLPSTAIATGLIRPPHLCRAMVVSEGEASHITNSYFNDQLRLLDAQQRLETAESQLQASQQGVGLARQKLETEIKRGQGERDLAIEFGKLREEYDLLKTEQERIASANKLAAPPASKGTVSTKVQGKIQSK
jgi:hypothetical protein